MAKTTTKSDVKNETLKVTVEFPDGSIVNQELSIREFQPNVAKGFQNSCFQSKIASGMYSGSIMIIDHARQRKL